MVSNDLQFELFDTSNSSQITTDYGHREEGTIKPNNSTGWRKMSETLEGTWDL